MEDFANTYKARKHDAFVLFNLKHNHKVAAFHLGGVAIECYLKSLMLTYHKIKNWNETSNRTKDAMFKQPISNPSHSLLNALKHMPDIYKRAKLDKNFMMHINKVMYPLGSTMIDYISIRYTPETNSSPEDWHVSFNYVCGWIEKNKEIIE